MRSRFNSSLILGTALSAGAYLGLAYFTGRSQLPQLLLLFAVAFAGYLLVWRSRPAAGQGLLLALGLRLLFLPAIPQLSDDYFRFLWDGTLVVEGENPYLHLPAALMAPGSPAVPGLSQELLLKLNSPYYYSVYPPVCQGIFALARLLGGDSYLLGCVLMRVVLLTAEAGTIWLLLGALRILNKPYHLAWLYAFNPLVIVELTGNLHFEALMIFFLLGSLYLLWRGREALSALALGLSIGVKLLPLMFLPFVLAVLGWKKFLRYGSLVALTLGILFWPFFSAELVRHLLNSLNLYFQKFEFNASCYYLLRWLGFRLAGYNLISLLGPALSLVTAGLIAALAFRQGRDSRQLPVRFLVALSVYLFLATVVHPWYLTTLVMLACLTPWRYPVVWSGLAVVSYAAYQTAAYQENLVLVSLEYLGVLGTLALEIHRYRKEKAFPAAPAAAEA